nr:hypothetical protein GCM10025699_00230 [Microbacterium flavescens]BFF12493.1 hypothetical protein GCM10025699_37960 [Microbacterium flavescens]
MLAHGVAGSSTGAAFDLLLLAIADGSLADGPAGLQRAADASALIRATELRPWDSCTGYRGYDDYPDYDTEYPGGARCVRECSCPSIEGMSWHDVIAKAARDVAVSNCRDGSATLSGWENADGVPESGRLADHQSEPWLALTPPRRTTQELERDPLNGAAFTAALNDWYELMSVFGLDRADDGAWQVPSVLREFVRAGQLPDD